MPIEGLPQNITFGQLDQEISQGGKFVIFEYTISVLIMTFKRPSQVFYIAPGQSGLSKGLPYTLLTLVMGWWGIPWGPIYSIMTLATNLGGGKDITQDVLNSMRR